MLKVNPQFDTERAAASETEHSHIRDVPETTATLNRGGKFQLSRQTSWIFIVTMLVSLVIFWVPLHKILTFAAHSEFSYIPLIPVISTFLVAIRGRSILAGAEPCPAFGGLIVTLGILVLCVTKLFPALKSADDLFLPAFAIVTTWWGLFVGAYGTTVAHKVLLPLGLLLFMIPLPHRASGEIIAFLQHGSAALAYSLFRMIGVPAIREGMVISLPHLTIEVAPECSGIRSSVSLLILTLAGANLYLHSTANKILLVSLLVPLCIFRNAVRVVTLSTLAIYVDAKFITGPLHHRGGILFFFLALIMLAPIVMLMRARERRSHGAATLQIVDRVHS